MSQNNNAGSGIGVTGLLLILFIALKLTHFIDWPWLWVLAPFWIPLSIALCMIWLYATLMLAARKARR